ncbi:unnamed protein product [Effrenium voratum]|nr:unnamed protein product [Effrenium voratum]
MGVGASAKKSEAKETPASGSRAEQPQAAPEARPEQSAEPTHPEAADSHSLDPSSGEKQDEPAEAEAGAVVQAEDSPQGAALVQAIEAEDWPLAEQLLTQRPQECQPNARTSDWDYCLLRAAAEEGAQETCRLLLQLKADANMRDKNNMTPLMGCIVGGDYNDIVAMLLEARADASATTDDGFTALKWATRLNREGAIALLRGHGMTGASTAFT